MLNSRLQITNGFSGCALRAPAFLPARLFASKTRKHGYRCRQFQVASAVAFSAMALTSFFFSAQAESLLLTGANVHTISGETLSPGQVLVENGKISAVGSTLSAAGARVVELRGQHLYPGFIALNTLLGLTEISGVRSTQDSNESGEYTPDVESWIAVNPDSELVPVSRANGIAFFEPVPQGAIVPGQSGLVGVEGWTTEHRTPTKRQSPWRAGTKVFGRTSEGSPCENARN